MQIGVFLPIGNNGWLLSEAAPQYRPSFELNRHVTLEAEAHGLDFVMSMIKLRGFGGRTEFWDHTLESFTLMSALAAVTSRIGLYATAATLVMPPAVVARMAATVDDVSGGRFGVNLVTGWQPAEYTQMGMWPGSGHFADRYRYLGEYATVLRDLWDTGRCDLAGEFFRMEDCRLSPRPRTGTKIICAGSSDEGMDFSARHADHNFCLGVGVNTPAAFAPTARRLAAAAARTGRTVTTFVLFMVISGETDAEAWEKWESYRAGADREAIANLGMRGAADTRADSNIRQLTDPASAVNLNLGTLVGSYATIARLLDRAAAVPGTGGVLIAFDDFRSGVGDFGSRIQPLMTSRQHLPIGSR